MGKGIVIFKGSTGFTQKYAQWIAEELNCDIVDWSNRKKIKFSDYETVIFGGRCYASSIDGLKWFKKHISLLSGKRMAVFAVGASPIDSPDIPKAMEANIPEEMRKFCPGFYMSGGLCYEKMKGFDKFLMSMFRKMVSKQEGTEEMSRMIANSYDISSKDYIKPLVDYIKS